ncbi:MAG: flagellar basal body P-ring protein FlgI [Bryobacteraceae bacterium]
MLKTSLCLIFLLLLPFPARAATRIKELATIEGVRDNQLLGYGLVVGLAGTGDKRQTVFSAQTLANLLERMGVSVAPEAILVRNTAAVMVTANLPPFGQTGARIDVSVAAIGDATNLQGGLLLLTPLRGADGQTYAVAQGAVVTGGFVAGRANNNQTVNHPTSGRVPNGAIIERAAPSVIAAGSRLRLQLRQADFTTAARLAEAINRKYAETGAAVARAENSALVSVQAPGEYEGRLVEFLAEIENLAVDADRLAKIVINERTGTIVMGKEVRISPVAILHGNLSVEIQTTFTVSQPRPFSEGTTVVVPEVGVGVKEEPARNLVLQQGATVDELVRGLTAIGSTPRDIIAILQNLRAAGALEAELEVI